MSEDKRKSTDYAAMERPIFEAWKDAGYFQRTPGFGEHAGESYTIVIPPPNITGVLHMGHALNDTHPDAPASAACACMRGFPNPLDHRHRPRRHLHQTAVDVGSPSRASPVWKSAARRSGRGMLQVARGVRHHYRTRSRQSGCSCDYSDEHFTLERLLRARRAEAVHLTGSTRNHLPRQAHRELVPALHHGHRRRRGRVRD